MLMLQIRRSLVPFLITTLLLQGFLPMAGNNRKILKNFVDEVLVNCINPDHSHPPMIPSDGEEKAEVFYLTQQDSSPTILWVPLICKFQISEKAFLSDPLFPEQFSHKFHSARAPPSIEV